MWFFKKLPKITGHILKAYTELYASVLVMSTLHVRSSVFLENYDSLQCYQVGWTLPDASCQTGHSLKKGKGVLIKRKFSGEKGWLHLLEKYNKNNGVK